MAFHCVCADAYQSYTFQVIQAIVLFMLFNLDLNVPDSLQEKQLKDCERVQLANPFTTRRVKVKTMEREAEQDVN